MNLRFLEEEAVAWLTEQLLGSGGPRSHVVTSLSFVRGSCYVTRFLLPTHCIYVFCMVMGTDGDYYPIRH